MLKLNTGPATVDRGDVNDRRHDQIPNNVNPNHYYQLQQLQQQQKILQLQQYHQYQPYQQSPNNYSPSPNSLNIPNSRSIPSSPSPSSPSSPSPLSPLSSPSSPNNYPPSPNSLTIPNSRSIPSSPSPSSPSSLSSRSIPPSPTNHFKSPNYNYNNNNNNYNNYQNNNNNNNNNYNNNNNNYQNNNNNNNYNYNQTQNQNYHQFSHPPRRNFINERTNSQESLADPFVNSLPVTKPRVMDSSQPISIQLQTHSKNQPALNHKKSSPIMRKDNPFKDTSEPHIIPKSFLTADDYVAQAIKFHENDQLEKSTEYFHIAADKDSPVGMVLYGLALRHGWGCKKNTQLAFEYLSKVAKVAENAIETISASSHKGELILAIYELGNCFRHGWGVQKSKSTAARYFQMAADLGDPDAQNETGHCYYTGEGVRKDMKIAAKYYRLAHEQGHGTMGNSWIFKEKYI